MPRILAVLIVALSLFASAHAAPPPISLGDTVYKLPIEDGVSMDEAIESMKLRANTINLKFVAHQPLHLELRSMGIDARRIEIFQFCDAGIAWEMIKFNPDFVAYMPCRIAALEDAEGKGWLIMVNLDFFMGAADLPPDIMKLAERVRNGLMEIIQAGAAGDI